MRRALPILILLLAFGLRLTLLDRQNIWGDEAFSIQLSKERLPDTLAGADTHPAFYPLALWAWLPLAGDSPYGVRALSAFFGLLMIPVVMGLARRAGGSEAAGWITGLLAAVSPLSIYYSQEARMYAPLAVFAAISWYALLRLIEDPQRLSRWHLLYVIASLGAIYSHYYGFFAIIAQNLVILVRLRRLWRWLPVWIALQFALALGFAPWLPRLLGQQGVQAGNATRDYLSAWGWQGFQMVWGRGLRSFSLGLSAAPDFQWLWIPTALLALWGALGPDGGDPPAAPAEGLDWAISRGGLRNALLIGALTPPTLAWLTLPFTPFFYERYLLGALGPFVTLAGIGIASLLTRVRGARHGMPLPQAVLSVLGWLGLGLALLGAGLSLNRHYSDPTLAKGRYGDMMAYIDTHREGRAALLLNNRLQGDLYSYYAIDGMPVYWFPPDTGWGTPGAQEQVKRLASEYDQLWLVMFGNPAEYDSTGVLAGWLSDSAYRAYRGGWVDSELSLYVTGEAEADQYSGAIFGEAMQLAAYGISSAEVSAGGALQIALQWRCLAPPGTDYTLFTHLITADEQIVAQFDGQPLGGARPTSGWQPGESLSDHIALLIDPATPPGRYYVQVGWYDWRTLERLPVTDESGIAAGERVILGEITVTGPEGE